MKTISEKILSAKSGRDARAGDIVVCDGGLRARHRRLVADGDRLLRADGRRPRCSIPIARLFVTRSLLAAVDARRPRRFTTEIRAFARRYGDAAARGRRRHQPPDRRRSGLARAGRSRHRRRQPHGDLRRAEPVRDRRRLVGSCRGDAHRADLAARAGDDQASRSRARGRVASPRRTSRSTLVAELGADGANYQALEFHGDGAAGALARGSARDQQPGGRNGREGRRSFRSTRRR